MGRSTVSQLIALLVFFFAISFNGSQDGFAQGRLRGVSNAARKNQPAPKPKHQPAPKRQPAPERKSAPKRKPTPKPTPKPARVNESHDDHDHDDHNDRNEGKLLRVSNGVRKNRPASKPARETHGHDSHDDVGHNRGGHQAPYRGQIRVGSRNVNHNGNRNRNNPHRHNHGSRNTGVIFYSPPAVCAAPIVEPVFAGPVFVDPILAQPAFEEVYAPVPQPLVSNAAQVPANSVYQSTVVESVPPVSVAPVALPALDQSIGNDWFYETPSKFWATIGSDFDGITSGGIGVNFQAAGSIGLDGSVMTLRESAEGYRDHLWIGDVNLMYEVLTAGDVRGRVGAGVNWLNDAWGAEAGFNLTAAVDVRLTDRLLMSAEGDLGTLGDADYFHGRVNLATRLDSCELLIGMDHFNIGGAEVNSVFTGLQFRF